MMIEGMEEINAWSRMNLYLGYMESNSPTNDLK